MGFYMAFYMDYFKMFYGFYGLFLDYLWILWAIVDDDLWPFHSPWTIIHDDDLWDL